MKIENNTPTLLQEACPKFMYASVVRWSRIRWPLFSLHYCILFNCYRRRKNLTGSVNCGRNKV